MNEKEKNKNEVIEVSKEEREKFLEDLVFKGCAFYEKTLLDGKLKIKLKTLSGEEQLEIDEKISDIEGTPAQVMHLYSILFLSYALVRYNDIDLEKLSKEERVSFLKSKPTAIIDKVSEELFEFNKKIKASVSGDKVEETFFETTPTSLE